MVPPGGDGCMLRTSASLMARSLLATSACTCGRRALAMQYTVIAPVPAARPIDS